MDKKNSTPLEFYTVDQIGEKRSFTPEGFLLCEDVPVARTGEMVYHASELTDGSGKAVVNPDSSGFIRISRSEDEVFRPEYLASFSGKPVTNEHPDEDVNPDNFRYLSVGTVMNPRRGSDEQADLVICDFMITDANAINEIVKNGKREVSVGYSADYVETAPGLGEQVNMIVNHVALVDSGRCGPRCAIGDSNFKKGASKMAKAKWYDKLKKALKSKDAEALGEAIKEIHDDESEMEQKEEPGNEHHVHVNLNQPGEKSRFTDEDHEEFRSKNDQEHAEMRARLDALEKMIAEHHAKMTDDEGEDDEEKKEEEKEVEEEEGLTKDDVEAIEEETGEKLKANDKNVRDSAFLADSYQSTVAGAEILAPGIRIPSFDAKQHPAKTFKDCICAMRRSALDLAYATPEGRGMIEEINGGKPLALSGMKCRDVASIFRGAVAAKKAANNNSRTSDFSHMTSAGVGVKSKVKSLAELNELHRSHYGRKA